MLAASVFLSYANSNLKALFTKAIQSPKYLTL